jgi:hypothetical protein
MKAKVWSPRRFLTIFATTISVAIIGVASAPASMAGSAPASPGASAKHLTPCGKYRILYGPWFAMDSYTARKLAWDQASGQFSGALVSLKKYSGSLDECWKLLGGFGGGKIEIEDTSGTFCLGANEEDPRSSDVPMQMRPCLSKKYQMFTLFGRHSIRLASDTRLCVSLDGPVQAGYVVYQRTCDTSAPRQEWWINESP